MHPRTALNATGISIGLALVVAWFFLASGIPETRRAKEQVRSMMRDPASVQFRGVQIYRKKNVIRYVVCGEFNAKNGFGAYAGFKAFYIFSDGDVRMQDSYRDFQTGWMEFCRG